MNETRFPLLHRLAAIGLLLAVIGVMFAVLVLPLIDHFGTLRAGIARERELLARFEAFAANRDAAASLAEHSEAAMRSGMFLDGETDALRLANLQALITEIAEKHGARVSSAREMPGQDVGSLHFIGVQTELEADLGQLQAMILTFESHRPYLFIQSLQATPLASRRPESDTLKIRFGIVGAAATSGVAKS